MTRRPPALAVRNSIEAVLAMVDTAEDGRTVEVGIVGREGIVAPAWSSGWRAGC